MISIFYTLGEPPKFTRFMTMPQHQKLAQCPFRVGRCRFSALIQNKLALMCSGKQSETVECRNNTRSPRFNMSSVIFHFVNRFLLSLYDNSLWAYIHIFGMEESLSSLAKQTISFNFFSPGPCTYVENTVVAVKPNGLMIVFQILKKRQQLLKLTPHFTDGD